MAERVLWSSGSFEHKNARREVAKAGGCLLGRRYEWERHS